MSSRAASVSLGKACLGRMEDLFSVEEMRRVLRYSDGQLYWRVKTSDKTMVGRKAGGKSGPYEVVRYKRSMIRTHRLVWALITGEWPSALVDHKDGDTTNNRFGNLRLATPQQNSWNRKVSKTSASGHKGIRKVGSKFSASIYGEKAAYIGTFGTLEEAKKAYAHAQKMAYGDFAHD